MTDSDSGSGQSKKRNRLSLSCTYCKKRKVKCDRGRPCSSCTKYNVVHLCEYPDPIWSEPVAITGSGNSHNTHVFTPPEVQSQLDMLKSKIREIESSLHKDNGSSKGATISTSPTSMAQNHKQHFNLHWEDFQYNPEKNPTYVGINPYASSEETINMYEGYTPIHIRDAARRMNYGPFAWLSIMKKDPGLKDLWKFMMTKKYDRVRAIEKMERSAPAPPLNSEIQSYNTASEQFTTIMPGETKKVEKDDQESIFREKAIDRDGYNDLRLYGNVMKKCIENCEKMGHLEEQRSQMNKHAISLGLTLYEGKMDRELQLIEKIKIILPKQKVVWTLINKFFLHVYPFMPFIDEDYFKLEMARILGPEDYVDDHLTDLKIEKRLDLANIGILLIILRFSYLALFSNRRGVNQDNLNTTDPSPAAQELKYLLSNPINIDVIDVAQLCLDQFELLRKSSMVVLQCAYFMRLYHMFAPEDGDGADGGDSQIFNGMLVQMAYSMGINREPDNFPDVCNDNKVNNLGRKIWFFLIINDLIQAYQYGNPLTIRESYYDTKLPYYKKGNENISDIEMEKNVISTFAYFEKYYYKLTAILDACLDIRQKVKMSHLTNLLNDFEVHLNDHYGTLRYFLVPFQSDNYLYPFVKTMKCKNYINMKGFLLTIYFHFYLYYERKKNYDFSYFYVKKIFSIICGEFVPSFFPLIANNHINFGETADLILNPTVETMIHKTTQISLAILVRLNCTIYHTKQHEDHSLNLRNNYVYKLKFAKLCKLSKILEKITQFSIAAMSRLSQRYYYAWRVTKAHSFLLKMVIGEDFYKYTEESTYEPFIDINSDQISELSIICETPLKKFSKTKIFNASGEFNDFNDEDIGLAHSGDKFGDMTTDNPVAPPDEFQAGASRSPISVPTGGNPSSVESFNNSEFEDYQFLENVEIDKLWFQMAAMKHDSSSNGNSKTAGNNAGAATGAPGTGATGNDNANFPPSRRRSSVDGASLTPMNLSIPTPMLNPLSPESLNANANNGSNVLGQLPGDELTTADVYPIDLFNILPIAQLLGLRDGQDENW
ncbi:fungal-specific transcription factor [Scheffersomyces xylosifermentans]|uniref:fungal-specific transcription factor n=1 Tax=Scheffersomyces xylosifermentans TaxID=1304137 RepID=UPI00315D9E19